MKNSERLSDMEPCVLLVKGNYGALEEIFNFIG